MKTATKRKASAVTETSTASNGNGHQIEAGHQATLSSSPFTALLLKSIVPSASEPQARRRAKFTKEEIAELAQSIKTNGLIQPITVRPLRSELARNDAEDSIVEGLGLDDRRYEIVCGERRFLACKKAGLDRMDCVVRVLSDAAALEIQGLENIQRKELDPIDEAFWYKSLLDLGKFTVHDLSIRSGRSEKNIRLKLRLNELIPEILAEVSKGWLPLGHAVEISKFSPELQKRIHKDEAAYEWKQGEDSNLLNLKDFKGTLRDEYLFSLKDAVFSMEATNLREDGLACVNCPERTGYEPLLFEEELKEGDSCLNEDCFDAKKKLFYQITRNAAATKLKVDPAKVEFATESYFSGSGLKGEKVHTWAKLYKTKTCDKAKPVVSVDPKTFGQPSYICQDSKCKKHRPDGSSSGSANANDQSREREFQVKAAEAVRHRILLEAVSYFDLRNFWTDEKIVSDLLLKLWKRESYWAKDMLPKWDPDAPKQSDEEKNVEKFIDGLSESKRSQLAFLLIYGGADHSSWKVSEHATVKQLNDRYAKLNYILVDAETRVELAPKEFKKQAQTYLKAIQSGEPAEAPHFWHKEKKEAGDA